MADEVLTPMTEEEVKKAEEAATNAQDLFVLKLKRPLTYNGRVYEELSFDFEGLTGADSLEVEAELSRRNIQVPIFAFSAEYIIRIAARACTTPIGSDAFKLMSLRDYGKVRSATRNFLMRTEQ